MNSSRYIKTLVADVLIDNDGIIIIYMKDVVEIDEFDVLDLNLIIRRLSDNKPALKLIDSRCNWSISPKAKRQAIQETSLNKTIARLL